MQATNINHKKIVLVVLMVFVLLAASCFLMHNFPNKQEQPGPKSDAEDSHHTPETAVHVSPSADFAVSATDGKPSAPLTSSHANLPSPITQLPLPELDDGYADAVLRVPGHPWQKERSENIKGETIEQTIDNFANIDDMHLAHTSISGITRMNTKPGFQSLVVTRLARVRKALAQGRVNPQRVVPYLKLALEKSLAGWPEAFRDYQRELNTSTGRRGGHEPDQFHKYLAQALGASYLLAELGDHESLPLILKGYKIHDSRWMYAPVPPALTLYAMHRLMLSFPEDQLDSEQREIRDHYLKLAECLPPPREITVTNSWYANYDESDPRIAIVDPQKKVLLREPTMQMAVYPHKFIDGEKVSDSDGRTHPVSERAKLLFAELERFVKVVYPAKYKKP